MAESKAVDIPPRATPYEASEPREAEAISQFGATFAERAKARAKAGTKQVDSGDVEDKAVKKTSTKRAPKKKS